MVVAGDLSLLASAATEAAASNTDSPSSNTKRRKTAPRKLGSYLLNNRDLVNNGTSGSDDDHDKDTEKENHGLMQQYRNKNDNSIKDSFLLNNSNNSNNSKLSSAIMNLAKSEAETLDLSVKSGDSPQSSSPPVSTTSQLQLLSSSMLPSSTTASPLNLLVSA